MLLELMLRDEYRKGKAEGLVEGKSEGRAEGLIEGKVEGLVEIIFDSLQEIGEISDELHSFISKETDLDKLKSFLREASKAGSISEFMENISFVSSK